MGFVQLPHPVDGSAKPELERGLDRQEVSDFVIAGSDLGRLTLFPKIGGVEACDRKPPWTANEPIRLEVTLDPTVAVAATEEAAE